MLLPMPQSNLISAIEFGKAVALNWALSICKFLALSFALQPGFVSVPAAATIYIQAVSSKALWDMHQLNPNMVRMLLLILEKF